MFMQTFNSLISREIKTIYSSLIGEEPPAKSKMNFVQKLGFNKRKSKGLHMSSRKSKVK